MCVCLAVSKSIPPLHTMRDSWHDHVDISVSWPDYSSVWHDHIFSIWYDPITFHATWPHDISLYDISLSLCGMTIHLHMTWLHDIFMQFPWIWPSDMFFQLHIPCYMSSSNLSPRVIHLLVTFACYTSIWHHITPPYTITLLHLHMTTVLPPHDISRLHLHMTYVHGYINMTSPYDVSSHNSHDHGH